MDGTDLHDDHSDSEVLDDHITNPQADDDLDFERGSIFSDQPGKLLCPLSTQFL